MRRRSLSPQATSLDEAQSEIKRLVVLLYFLGAGAVSVYAGINGVVKSVLTDLTTPALVQTAPVALTRLGTSIYDTLRADLGEDGIEAHTRYIEAQNMGVPAGRYMRDYMESVRHTLDEIADRQALDPDDWRGRQTLRNKAEMETRYEAQQTEIDRYRAEGVKLVMCSAHADCSDRCFPWQGRVYSLDRTSGTTVDGLSYIPLETATDIFYTTHTGRVYKNGLLGFNCRHKLYRYEAGMKVPWVSKETQEHEYGITMTQRRLEGRVRYYKERALVYKGIDPVQYRLAKRNAQFVYDYYKEFSAENGRAYYPDRVRII